MIDKFSVAREKLAGAILAEFKRKITGATDEPVVGDNPENKFFVGKLLTKDTDTSSGYSSDVFIESVGADFYIDQSEIKKAEITVFPRGEFYYRCYPTLEQQRAALLEEANELLGYPFFVTGEIIHGRQIGRTIGVPTANLIADQSKYLPPNGVYYTLSDTSGKKYKGVTNIGTKPTVDGHFVGVETYFFDCDDDLYGEDLKVSLLHFARPEHRFHSLEELKDQIRKDEEGAREFFC